MNNANSPQVLAVVALPNAQERRLGEIMLARTMLLAIDMILSGEPLGLVTARDLFREVRSASSSLGIIEVLDMRTNHLGALGT